jgi:hypothetical protein
MECLDRLAQVTHGQPSMTSSMMRSGVISTSRFCMADWPNSRLQERSVTTADSAEAPRSASRGTPRDNRNVRIGVTPGLGEPQCASSRWWRC